MSWKTLIKENDLVRKLSPEKQRKLINAIEIIKLPANRLILSEGDPCDGCYFIFSGEVQIYTAASNGQVITLTRLGPGQYFGEQACLMPPFLRTASVSTLTKVELGRIEKKIFLEILEKQPNVINQLSLMGREQLLHKIKTKDAFFSTLTDQIFNITPEQIVEYEKDDIIFNEGDQPNAVYFILQGDVILTSTKKSVSPKIHLGHGNIFGELAVIKNQPRFLTAIVKSPHVKLIKFEPEHFKKQFQSSKRLQQWLKSLQMVYQIPQRGLILQSMSELAGMPCISIVMSLENNQQIIVNKLLELDIVSISFKEKHNNVKVIRYEDKHSGVLRELSIANHKIVGIHSMGFWENLPEVCETMFSTRDLVPIEVDIFSKRGDFHLYPIPRFYEAKDIVCNCMKVTYQQIYAIIQKKPADLETVCDETGAGLVCGSCRPRIAQILGRPFWMPARIEEVISHSNTVKSFRFKKLKDEKINFKPGQHVIIQCNIQGEVVERSYTLTSVNSQKDFYEITIKRENQGLFSRWIFDPSNHNRLFKISSPQGHFTIDFAAVPQAIFFSGGIGITPAIAFARHMANERPNSQLFIDYSFHQENDGVFLSQLKELATSNPNLIKYQHRITDQHGRIKAEDIKNLLAEYPQAEIYICGPAEYQEMVHNTLLQLNISPEKIHIEVFTPATTKPKVKVADYPQDELGCPLAYRGKMMSLCKKPEVKVYKNHQEEAHDFLKQFYDEMQLSELLAKRWRNVKQEMTETGHYWQTTDELTFGARLAWKNSTRCIGRDQWNTLLVRDFRHLKHEDDVFQALLEHIKFATNGGNLQPIISVFAPPTPHHTGPRILNNQLARYAGYRMKDGSILGDPSECEITEIAESLGWFKAKKTEFDILPLLIKMPNRPCKYFEIPKDYILEVPITHPKVKEVASLNLKWYAVPMVSNMCLAVGGLRYTAAPFNGWYMETEIGARNFGDVYRYNILPKLAEKMGLDTSTERSLWRDFTLAVINVAVLYSFERAGVKIIDHHSASRNFLNYAYHEIEAGHELFANWSWIVPPISGSGTGVYHQGYQNIQRLPNFLYQKLPATI